MNKKSILLMEVVMIIVLLSFVALGISAYLFNALGLDVSNANQDKALYAAQAGVMSAIVDYVNNGSITAETDIELEPGVFYSTGGAGMFFLADASNPSVIANRKLKNIHMTNLSSTDDITITHMEVSWIPDGGENLISIDLGRATAEWTGTAQSGTNIDMTDYTIPAGVTENDVWLDWEVGSDITSMTISVILTFSDGSKLEIVLLDEGLGAASAIVITSTGKVVEMSDTWKRTLKAAYDTGTSEIISWEESEDHL